MSVSQSSLSAIVQRGQNRGIRVTPHKYTDGKYRVAKKKEDRPIKVDFDEIESYIRRGYGLRMSNRLKRHPPGLFMPKSIDGWR
jgi:hypothetical protein